MLLLKLQSQWQLLEKCECWSVYSSVVSSPEPAVHCLTAVSAKPCHCRYRCRHHVYSRRKRANSSTSSVYSGVAILRAERWIIPRRQARTDAQRHLQLHGNIHTAPRRRGISIFADYLQERCERQLSTRGTRYVIRRKDIPCRQCLIRMTNS